MSIASMLRLASRVTIVALLVSGVGCAGTTGSGTTAPTASSASKFLSCGEHDLYQMVGDKTLLATVAVDLLQSNYTKLIADLIVRVGAIAVGCAVLAIDAVDSAGAVEPRIRSTSTSRGARAKELIELHGWQLEPLSTKK